MSDASLKKIQDLIDVEGFVSNPGRIKSKYPNFKKGLSWQRFDSAYNEISSWLDYSPTPLSELSDLAKFCKVGKIFYKDESSRLGLGSFKALGGAYAVRKVANNYSLKNKKND